LNDLARIYDKIQELGEKVDAKFEDINEKIHVNQLKVTKDIGSVKINMARVTGSIALICGFMGAYLKDFFHK